MWSVASVDYKARSNVVRVLQAVPGKHDVGVPAPFEKGQDSESSLGVSVRPSTGVNAAQSGAEPYVNIAQVCHAAGACPYAF